MPRTSAMLAAAVAVAVAVRASTALALTAVRSMCPSLRSRDYQSSQQDAGW